MDEYYQEYHLKISCDKCGYSLSNQANLFKQQYGQHQMGAYRCRYCKLDFPINELSLHEYLCDIRMKFCAIFSNNILMRDC